MKEEEEFEEEEDEKEQEQIEEKNKNEINKDNNNNVEEEKKLYNIKINNKIDNDNNIKSNDENIIKENIINNEPKETKENGEKNSNIEFNNELTKEIDNLQKLTERNDLILNKLLSNKKRKNEDINKSDNQIILENQKQIKKDLFKNFGKNNNRLTKKIFPLEQTTLKNFEIDKLKRQMTELQNKYNKIKNENEEYQKKNKQLEGIIIRLKEKNLKAKGKVENNRQGYKMSLQKNYDFFKIKEYNLLKNNSYINLNDLNKSQSARIIYDNDNFYHLLTNKERKCLKNLFGSYEEYYSFCNKLNIIDSRNKKAENQLKAEIAKLIKYIRSQEKDIIKLNEGILQRNEIINILENQLNILRRQNNMITNKHKRILKFEETLKDENFNIKSMPNKIKLKKLNILVNHYNEELNKIHIEKSKLEEIDKINKKICNIYFIDHKFFENLPKNNDNNNNNSISFSSIDKLD